MQAKFQAGCETFLMDVTPTYRRSLGTSLHDQCVGICGYARGQPRIAHTFFVPINGHWETFGLDEGSYLITWVGPCSLLFVFHLFHSGSIESMRLVRPHGRASISIPEYSWNIPIFSPAKS